MEGVAIVELDGLVGLINIKGETITPIQFEEINRIDQNFYVARSMGKLGLIDSRGEQLLEPTYHRISKIRNGLLRLEDQSQIAYYDITKREYITLKK